MDPDWFQLPPVSGAWPRRQLYFIDPIALDRRLIKTPSLYEVAGRKMSKVDAGFDYHRYRQLLAEAVDEDKRRALIDLLIEERARERLQVQRTSERLAMTARTVAAVLGTSRN